MSLEPIREGRHLAAIMFVDMVGYSARMQRDEPAAISAVRELWDAVRPALASHGGREVDLVGDGMLMEFSGALAAVRCALDIHQVLRKANAGKPEPVRVRAGVHLGDIEHKDGRIYGDGVNIAARVITVCPPGGIAMTPHVRDQLRNVLNEPLESLGPKAFKNIREPIEVWCLAGPDCTAADRAAARAALRAEGADRRWSFGKAVFDERTLELSLDGAAVELEKKSLDVLAFLLAHAGEVVTKDEIVEAAWPGRVISDSALTTSMTKLRAALGDDAQELIRTVHGYGYRLAAEVKIEIAAAPVAAPHFDFKEGDRPPSRPLWKLVRKLGAGGHGEAWLARHEKTGEQRVYKFALDVAHLASLKREITLSRVLGGAPAAKAHFVTVLDWNLEQPPCFVESEYASGGSLLDWSETQGGIDKVPLPARLELVAQAAEALALAHSVGVLHKDLKPANLLVETGGGSPRVKLGDFGTGGVVDAARLAELGITRMGFTKTLLDSGDSGSATALYLAPEVLAGQPWTSKADVYALGLVLFQLAVGDFHRTLAPGWEREVGDELLCEDIAAAAAGTPGQRLGDAGVLATRLRTLQQRREAREQERTAARLAAREREKYSRYRVRRWWVAGVAALFGTGLVASFFLWFDTQNSAFRSLEALEDIAQTLEREGHLKEAEGVFRQIVEIKKQQSVGPLFPGGLLPWPYYLEPRLDLARVLVKEGRLLAAQDTYARLLDDAARAIGKNDPYYGWLLSNYGECLMALGKSEPARQALIEAKTALASTPDASPEWRKANDERLQRLETSAQTTP